MKVCKIIRIHDGKCETVQNGDFMFIETFPRAQKMINRMISEEGYEVIQVMPVYSPAERNDDLNFYRGGFVFYLEKEVTDEAYDHIMSKLDDYKKYGCDDDDDYDYGYDDLTEDCLEPDDNYYSFDDLDSDDYED